MRPVYVILPLLKIFDFKAMSCIPVKIGCKRTNKVSDASRTALESEKYVVSFHLNHFLGA